MWVKSIRRCTSWSRISRSRNSRSRNRLAVDQQFPPNFKSKDRITGVGPGFTWPTTSEERQVFVKTGNGRSDPRLKNGSGQPEDAVPEKESGSGDVAGTVSDSEQVDRMAAQIRQSSRGEDVIGTGSSPQSSQIPRSVRLRVHGPSVPRRQQDSQLVKISMKTPLPPSWSRVWRRGQGHSG